MVEEMQRISYGWIENLPVQNGEPVFDERVQIVREVAFGRPAKQRNWDRDFELKGNIVEMLEAFSRIRDGTISRLRVQDGMPVQMHLIDHF
jgi:hypothetical protein